MKNAIISVAESRQRAEQLVNELEATGVAKADISVLPAEAPRAGRWYDRNAIVAARSAIGASAVAVFSGAFGVIVGLGILEVPGLERFDALGPLLTCALFATVGAAVGAATGALVGLRVSRAEYRRAQSSAGDGKLLVSVRTESSDAERRAKHTMVDRSATFTSDDAPGGPAESSVESGFRARSRLDTPMRSCDYDSKEYSRHRVTSP